MGTAAVGKMSIVSQFLHATFPKKYKPTVDDFHRQILCRNEDYSFQLDILDTTGVSSNATLQRLTVGESDAFVLVYAVDDRASFEEVRRLRQLVIEARGDEAPIVVVGNKCDLIGERRVVDRVMAQCTANIDWNHGYVETSAMDNANIADIFEELMVQAGLNLSLSMTLARDVFDPSRRKSTDCLTRRPCCVIL